jgi:hypothetical protein
MIVLSWLNFYPDDRPEDIAEGSRRRGRDRAACADLASAGLIEPTTWH